MIAQPHLLGRPSWYGVWSQDCSVPQACSGISCAHAQTDPWTYNHNTNRSMHLLSQHKQIHEPTITTKTDPWTYNHTKKKQICEPAITTQADPWSYNHNKNRSMNLQSQQKQIHASIITTQTYPWAYNHNKNRSMNVQSQHNISHVSAMVSHWSVYVNIVLFTLLKVLRQTDHNHLGGAFRCGFKFQWGEISVQTSTVYLTMIYLRFTFY